MQQGNFSKAANLPVSSISQPAAAEMLNVGERSLRSAKTVLDNGVPELAQAVDNGLIAVSIAASIAKEDKPTQTRIVKRITTSDILTRSCRGQASTSAPCRLYQATAHGPQDRVVTLDTSSRPDASHNSPSARAATITAHVTR